MNLYLYYLKLTIQGAFKNPKKALKIFPGLIFLLIGFVLLLIAFNIHPSTEGLTAESLLIEQNLGILYLTGIALFIPLIYLPMMFANNPMGFRYCDANLLMKAPVHPFDAYVFIALKQMVMYIGLSFFMVGTQAAIIVNLVKDPSMLLYCVVLFLINIQFVNVVAYLITYTKMKKPVLTRVLQALYLASFLFAMVLSFWQHTLNLTADIRLHLFPILGWNLAVMYHLANHQYLLALVYVAVSILVLILLVIAAKKIDFDYYEYELSRVNKTEKAIKKAEKGRNSDIKYFKQSKLEFTQPGDRVLIEHAKLTSGKFWFISLRYVFRYLLIVSIVVVGFVMSSGTMNLLLLIGILLGVKFYIGTFTLSTDSIYSNFYLKLFPIPVSKKVIYSLYNEFRILILELIILIVSVVFTQLFLKQYVLTFFEILVAVFIYFIFGLMDLLKEKNLISFSMNKFGTTLSFLFSFIELILKLILFAGATLSLYYFVDHTIAYLYLFFASIIYLVLYYLLSVYLYKKFDYSAFRSED